jgi:hypothetical protein
VTSNADYSFQRAIPKSAQLVIPEALTIIGVGAFGSWVAFLAARVGIRKITLINPTKANGGRDIEGRSVACGPYRDDHFGQTKVSAARQMILEARPDIEVLAVERAYDPAKDAELLTGVVINGVSDDAVHAAIWEQCRERGIRCASGIYCGINAGALSYQPKEIHFDIDSPVWAVSAALAASMALHVVCTNVGGSYYGDLSDIYLSPDELEDRLNTLCKAI